MSYPSGLRTAAELGADKPHGVRMRYMSGCRCLKCRMANSNYETARAAARRRGEGNGLVDAAPVRVHLRYLSRQGVGHRAVADAASVARSTVKEILAGRKRQLRAQTARRLLSITTAARADAAVIPAARTWQLINLLLEEGFTKARIARELGQKRALQIRPDFVLARTQLAVEKLWRRYQT